MYAEEHAQLLQRAGEVGEAARSALKAAWLRGSCEEKDPPIPSKATVMSYLTFLAHWTRNWAQQTFLFEETFGEARQVQRVDIRATFLPVLKEMEAMAAAMCLRSSAAEAQDQQQEKTMGEDQAASLSEAMACRILDPRTVASSVWAFNTGGSLRFIGDRGEIPPALRSLWDFVRRHNRGERIVEPPVDLGKAGQEELRALLLDMMRGHNMSLPEAGLERSVKFSFETMWR